MGIPGPPPSPPPRPTGIPGITPTGGTSNPPPLVDLTAGGAAPEENTQDFDAPGPQGAVVLPSPTGYGGRASVGHLDIERPDAPVFYQDDGGAAARAKKRRRKLILAGIAAVVALAAGFMAFKKFNEPTPGPCDDVPGGILPAKTAQPGGLLFHPIADGNQAFISQPMLIDKQGTDLKIPQLGDGVTGKIVLLRLTAEIYKPPPDQIAPLSPATTRGTSPAKKDAPPQSIFVKVWGKGQPEPIAASIHATEDQQGVATLALVTIGKEDKITFRSERDDPKIQISEGLVLGAFDQGPEGGLLIPAPPTTIVRDGNATTDPNARLNSSLYNRAHFGPRCGARFYPATGGDNAMSPRRLLDTRGAPFHVDPDELLPDSAPVARLGPQGRIHLKVLGHPGLPQQSPAIAVITVEIVESKNTGQMFLWSGRERPQQPGINIVDGKQRATLRLVVVPIGADGDLNFVNETGETDIVLNLWGYFAP